MAWKKIDDTKLTAIADAIRGKTGGTAAITLDAMPAEIAAIETGGGNTIEVTVDSGATVYATSGTKTVSGVSVNGVCALKIPEAGTWTVWAELDGASTPSIEVVVVDVYTGKLSFAPQKITFFVTNGHSVIECKADEGMAWLEFVNIYDVEDAYNYEGLFEVSDDDDYVWSYHSGVRAEVFYGENGEGGLVKKTDVIIAGQTYYTSD